MASVRLRKAFQYPSDTDSDEEDPGEGITKQEQQSIIQSLAQQNAATNLRYKTVLLLFTVSVFLHYVFFAIGKVLGLSFLGAVDVSGHPFLYFGCFLWLSWAFMIALDIPTTTDQKAEPSNGTLFEATERIFSIEAKRHAQNRMKYGHGLTDAARSRNRHKQSYYWLWGLQGVVLSITLVYAAFAPSNKGFESVVLGMPASGRAPLHRFQCFEYCYTPLPMFLCSHNLFNSGLPCRHYFALYH